MNSNNAHDNSNFSCQPDSTGGGRKSVSMTLRPLYEAAALDSFGLLEEHEVEAFERAFAVAHPAIAAQIAALQSRLVHSGLDGSGEAGLGEPSPELRQRVLAAVAAEIAAVELDSDIDAAVQLDPAVVARLGIGGVVAGSVPAQPNYRRRVHHLWRAAAIGSIAAIAFLTVSTFTLRAEFLRLEAAAQTAQASSLISSYGRTFENALLNPDARMIQFAEVNPTTGANRGIPAALVIFEPGSSQGHLLARDVARSNEALQLVLLDKNGQPTKVLAAINASRAAFQFEAELASGASLGIMPVSGDASSLVLKSKGSAVTGLALAETWNAFLTQ